MAILIDAIKDKNLDIRLVNKNLSRGILSAQEYDQAVKNLQDDSEEAAFVSVEELDQEPDTRSVLRS